MVCKLSSNPKIIYSGNINNKLIIWAVIRLSPFGSINMNLEYSNYCLLSARYWQYSDKPDIFQRVSVLVGEKDNQGSFLVTVSTVVSTTGAAEMCKEAARTQE